MTDFRAHLGRASALAFLSFAGAACATDGPPRAATETTAATAVGDGNVVVVTDKDGGRPGHERLVYTIRTGGDGVQILHGGGNATYEVDGRQVKIYTSGGPGETLARSDGASERGCERKVAEHPGGDGRNRIVTIVCTRLRVNAAADASAYSTQKLETALARIEHEDKLGAEVKEQVESALREAIEQLRERR